MIGLHPSTTTAATTAVSIAISTEADPTDSLFGKLNICKSTSLETTTIVNARQAYPGSIFSASAFAYAASHPTRNRCFAQQLQNYRLCCL